MCFRCCVSWAENTLSLPAACHFLPTSFLVVSVSGVWCTVLISYTACCHFNARHDPSLWSNLSTVRKNLASLKYYLYQKTGFGMFFIYNLVIKLSFTPPYCWSHSKEIVWFIVYKLVFRCVLHFCFPVFSQLLSIIMIVKELKFCCIWFHFVLRSW